MTTAARCKFSTLPGSQIVSDLEIRNSNFRRRQAGGFTILELPSLDAALEWAARCPAASYGAVEVRPIAGETHKRVTGEYPNQ